MDERICLKLQQDIRKISFYVTMKPFVMLIISCFEKYIRKGGRLHFLGRPVQYRALRGATTYIRKQASSTIKSVHVYDIHVMTSDFRQLNISVFVVSCLHSEE